jgi:hypothetical protein
LLPAPNGGSLGGVATAGCKRFIVGVVSVALGVGVLLTPTAAGAATAAGRAKNPTLSVTPSTGLVDYQTVHVVGLNFPANGSIPTAECVKGTTGEAGCDLSTLSFSTASASGSFMLDQFVHRILITLSNTRTDCAKAPGSCVLAAEGGPTGIISVPLSFNPKVPPRTATITVTPSTNLVDHQLVTLIGNGVLPGQFVEIDQCAPGTPGPLTCDGSTFGDAPTGATGGFYLRWAVHRILLVGNDPKNPTTVDCAKVKCQVVVSLSGPQNPPPPGEAPLSFNPGAPPARQSLFVTPHRGLADEQLVTVSGDGFTPGVQVSLLECPTGVSAQIGCAISGTTAGFVGHFETEIPVFRFLTLTTGHVDCASAPGACTLTAVNGNRPSLEHAMVPLSFNPNIPPPTVTVAVTPNTGLHDDQEVTVRGGGLTPLGSVEVSECGSTTVNGIATPFCVNTVNATADPTGHASTVFFVHAVITGPHGLISCLAKPGNCSIGIDQSFAQMPEAEAPLTFG